MKLDLQLNTLLSPSSSSEHLTLELDSSRPMMTSGQSIYPTLVFFNCFLLETLKILRPIKIIAAHNFVSVKFTGMAGDNDDGGHDSSIFIPQTFTL